MAKRQQLLKVAQGWLLPVIAVNKSEINLLQRSEQWRQCFIKIAWVQPDVL